jgi:hypothetical protein
MILSEPGFLRLNTGNIVDYKLNTNETCQKVPFRGFRGKLLGEAT